MNNNYNYNNQPVNNMNPNMNYSQPMNNQMNMNQGYSQQPMNQPINYNMNYGYVQPKQPFKFPALAKDLPSILGYIGAIIVMIGSLLTFATFKVKLNGESILDESVNYFITDGRVKDGMFIFLLAIVALGLIHFRKNLLSLIPTGIASILVIFDVVDANSRIEDLNKIYESYGSWLEYKVDAGFGPAPFIVAVGRSHGNIGISIVGIQPTHIRRGSALVNNVQGVGRNGEPLFTCHIFIGCSNGKEIAQ